MSKIKKKEINSLRRQKKLGKFKSQKATKKDLKATTKETLPQISELTKKRNLKPWDQLKKQRLLQTYYKDFFPFEEFGSWLSYKKFDNLSCREFAYTFVPGYFKRYVSYRNFREMKYEIYSRYPLKIDVGAHYNKKPVKIVDGPMDIKPVEKELIFDIDLSDYNDVRTCCKDAKICDKCWKFAAIACKILDASFREDFGWKHILWVFSGRRGIHGWVCDRDARQNSQTQREAIVNYYTVKKSRTGDKPKISESNQYLQRRLIRAYNIAVEYFTRILLEQNILGTPEAVRRFMKLLPTKSCQEKVAQLFANSSTSLHKWITFCEYWKSEEKSCTDLWKLRPHLMMQIVLHYLYPRIDVSVTRDMKHLLKAPFSFHPKSFLLCTPFDPQKVDNFEISKVPSLFDFYDILEGGRIRRTRPEVDRMKIGKYKESLRIFHNFVESLEE